MQPFDRTACSNSWYVTTPKPFRFRKLADRYAGIRSTRISPATPYHQCVDSNWDARPSIARRGPTNQSRPPIEPVSGATKRKLENNEHIFHNILFEEKLEKSEQTVHIGRIKTGTVFHAGRCGNVWIACHTSTTTSSEKNNLSAINESFSRRRSISSLTNKTLDLRSVTIGSSFLKRQSASQISLSRNSCRRWSSNMSARSIALSPTY